MILKKYNGHSWTTMVMNQDLYGYNGRIWSTKGNHDKHGWMVEHD